MTLPRLLVIMGSGETAPTMKVPHRRVFEQIIASGHTVDPVMLDTPFGFQENAPILAASTTKYFSDSVSQDVAVAGLARTDTGDSAAIESAMTKIRDANWVFAGPGSPTFALRQWHRTGLRDVLAEKLATSDQGGGGALVFSSAAALTLGVATVPVYEIYKVGMDPWWEPGLDLLSEIGVNAAVIPHYDNQEGGNHDTRFCYLGERRLTMLEPELPEGAFVLGLDEHTGVIIDLDADTAEIVGKGGLTLRRDGTSLRHEAGSTIPLDVIRSGGDERADRHRVEDCSGRYCPTRAGRLRRSGRHRPQPGRHRPGDGVEVQRRTHDGGCGGSGRCGPRPRRRDRRVVGRHAAVRRDGSGPPVAALDDRQARIGGHRWTARPAHRPRPGRRGCARRASSRT